MLSGNQVHRHSRQARQREGEGEAGRQAVPGIPMGSLALLHFMCLPSRVMPPLYVLFLDLGKPIHTCIHLLGLVYTIMRRAQVLVIETNGGMVKALIFHSPYMG